MTLDSGRLNLGTPERIAPGLPHGGDDPFGRNAERFGDLRVGDNGGDHFFVQAPPAQARLIATTAGGSTL